MSALRREPGVIARRIAGETILVPSTRRAREMALFTLNEVGTLVWEQMDGTRDTAALVRCVLDAYDVSAECAERDVRAFLAELQSAGCLAAEPAHAAGPAMGS